LQNGESEGSGRKNQEEPIAKELQGSLQAFAV
jgi:hypothetical protein